MFKKEPGVRPDGMKQDRYASVNELRSEVSRFIDTKPVAAYRENAFELVQRWALRNKPILILILAYLVMRVIVALVARQRFKKFFEC